MENATSLNGSNYVAPTPFQQPQNKLLDFFTFGQDSYFKNISNQNAMRAYQDAQNALDKQFQIDFDSTKYQRAVKDMEKAGLNPYYAMMQNASVNTTGSVSGSSAKTAYKENKAETNGFVSSALKVLMLLAVKSFLG